MKILLISLNKESKYMRVLPLGLFSIAQSAIDAGHSVHILELLDAKDIISSIKEAINSVKPDIIGISIRNIDNQDMENTEFFYSRDKVIIKEIKKYFKSFVVLGGAGYSIYPYIILEDTCADFGIQGEGEKVFPLLLERLSQGKPVDNIPQLYINNKPQVINKYMKTSLDEFELPDLDIMSQCLEKNVNDLWFPVQTRRGCPLNCSYCSTALIEGKMIRKRKPIKVVQWLKSLTDYGIRNFYFVDNTFNMPNSYALELCKHIIDTKLNINWRCIIYPYKLNRELCASMAKAGCSEVSLGIESGNDEILKDMNKLYRKADVVEASDNLRSQGIKRTGFLMLGGPKETIESVNESLNFVDSLQLDALKITIGIRIYPHTKLAEQAVNSGIINKNDNLLTPKFYLNPFIKDDIKKIVEEFKREHAYCV